MLWVATIQNLYDAFNFCGLLLNTKFISSVHTSKSKSPADLRRKQSITMYLTSKKKSQPPTTTGPERQELYAINFHT